MTRTYYISVQIVMISVSMQARLLYKHVAMICSGMAVIIGVLYFTGVVVSPDIAVRLLMLVYLFSHVVLGIWAAWIIEKLECDAFMQRLALKGAISKVEKAHANAETLIKEVLPSSINQADTCRREDDRRSY